MHLHMYDVAAMCAMHSVQDTVKHIQQWICTVPATMCSSERGSLDNTCNLIVPRNSCIHDVVLYCQAAAKHHTPSHTHMYRGRAQSKNLNGTKYDNAFLNFFLWRIDTCFLWRSTYARVLPDASLHFRPQHTTHIRTAYTDLYLAQLLYKSAHNNY